MRPFYMATQNGKCQFCHTANSSSHCNRFCIECNYLLALCSKCTQFHVFNPGVFLGLVVCLIYELEIVFTFKLVNGLSRGLYLSNCFNNARCTMSFGFSLIPFDSIRFNSIRFCCTVQSNEKWRELFVYFIQFISFKYFFNKFSG